MFTAELDFLLPLILVQKDIQTIQNKDYVYHFMLNEFFL